MSFSEPVAEFMDVLGPFYEVVDANHNPDPYQVHHKVNNVHKLGCIIETSGHTDNCDRKMNGRDGLNSCRVNGCSVSPSEESDEEYSDTVDQLVGHKVSVPFLLKCKLLLIWTVFQWEFCPWMALGTKVAVYL